MSNEIVFDTENGMMKSFVSGSNDSKEKELVVFDTNLAAKEGTLQRNTVTYKLVPEDDPILKEVMPEFDFTNPPVNPNQFASALVDTCITNNGLGLSANQCGFRYRVFVMGSGDNYIACFNPKVIKEYGETHMAEGCLSFPLMSLNITRAQEIDVEYQDFNGEKRTAHFSGITARCFLHELDHMNGIVYTDKVKPLALKMAKSKRAKITKKVERYSKNMIKKVKHGNTSRVR